jgi:hypothetical protein
MIPRAQRPRLSVTHGPEAPSPESVRPVGAYRLADAMPAPPSDVPRLLWGWPQLIEATGIPRWSLEREMHRGFPKPVRRCGRRPFWKPSDVIAWAEGKR